MLVGSPPFPKIGLRSTTRTAMAVVTLTFLAACATDQSGVTEPSARLDSKLNSARDASSPTVQLASPGWQLVARKMVSDAKFTPIAGGHAYPLLGVAQYLAVQRAEARGGKGDREDKKSSSDVGVDTDRGAVAGASVAVLSYLFSSPAQVQSLEDIAAAQATTGSEKSQRAFAAAEAIGRAVGAEIVARAKADGFSIFKNPAPPTGPGFWTTNDPALPVVGGQLPDVTRWFLKSARQFRPRKPPAFGSAAFNAARDEILNITTNRTSQQEQIAIFWALNPGTPTASGFWLGLASGWIESAGFSERQATHVFALVSATMADATVGCWDAKLHYWLIRPWKADTRIQTIALVGRPNHPSYPSGHSCVSASGAEVLRAFFPEKGAQLDAMVTEAGLSRMYAGIHYRFDIEAGQRLGRRVAHFTIKADASGHSVLTDTEHKDK